MIVMSLNPLKRCGQMLSSGRSLSLLARIILIAMAVFHLGSTVHADAECLSVDEKDVVPVFVLDDEVIAPREELLLQDVAHGVEITRFARRMIRSVLSDMHTVLPETTYG